MDSDNGRRTRIFGVDFIDGRPVETVTRGPQLPGPAPPEPVYVESSDDDEVVPAPPEPVNVESSDDDEVEPALPEPVNVEESDDDDYDEVEPALPESVNVEESDDDDDYDEVEPALPEPANMEESDVDVDDDDEVFVLSRTAFEEVLRSRRDESRSAADNRGSGETLASNQQTIRDNNMQLEGRPSPSMAEPVEPPLPSRAPFDCPICMGPFVEEVTTKCGHVFCEECIRSAIFVQSNCPTCRRKITCRDLMRIYLPSGN